MAVSTNRVPCPGTAFCFRNPHWHMPWVCGIEYCECAHLLIVPVEARRFGEERWQPDAVGQILLDAVADAFRQVHPLLPLDKISVAVVEHEI